MRQKLMATLLLLLAPTDAAACAVDVTPVAFGAVELTRITRANGRIRLDCPVSTTVEVAIGGATAGRLRALLGPGGRVIWYQLAADPGFHRPWGDGTNGGQPVQVTVNAGETQALTIYGVVPAQPGVPPGDYVDQLVVTVTY